MLLKINKMNRLLPVLVVVSFAFAPASSFAQSTSQADNVDFVLPGKPLSLAEAVEITLKNSATIQQQKLGVTSAQARLQIAKGSFDITTNVAVNVSQHHSTPIQQLPDYDTQSLTGYLSKRFRSGISSRLSFSLERNSWKSPSNTSNAFNMGVTVDIPLLKGRGSKGSAAAVTETNARLNHEAALLDYNHQISQVILTTIQTYWDYRAAIANLENQRFLKKAVLTWSKKAEEGISDDKKQQIERKFASQIRRLEGYLTEKQRNVIAAEEQMSTTKNALAKAMGIPYNQSTNLKANEEFPENWSDILQRLQEQPMKEQWVEQASQNRFDIQAQQLRLQASTNSLARARQDLLPKLDLSFNYHHLEGELGNNFNDYFKTPTSGQEGRDASATLTLTYPLGNNIAKGSLDIANVTHKTNVITTNNLLRTVSLQVDADEGTLMSRLQEVEKNRKITEDYSESLKNYFESIDSLAENPLALFDLIELEKDYSDATDELLESLLELAKTIAQLRFQTGTLLVPVGESDNEWGLADMTTLPGIEDI